MTLSTVMLPYQYFPNPTKGVPLAGGEVYVGEPDTDPTIVANQKQIVAIQESGAEVDLSQPVTLGAGGVPLYNGSPVRLSVAGNYSIAVLNSQGAQVYYNPNASETFNPVVPVSSFTESQTLSSGQTSVTFANDIRDGQFFIVGPDADNGRLEPTDDYTVDLPTKTVTLTQSYPAGTVLMLGFLESVGTPVVDATYATVALMKAASIEAGKLVQTAGYYDGWAALKEPLGGGKYNTATLADVRSAKGDATWVPDELINHTLSNGVIAMLIHDESLSVHQCGAVGNGTTDDSAPIQAAIDSIPSMKTERITFNALSYYIGSGLTINPTATDNITAVLEGKGGGMFGLSDIESTRIVTDQAIDMLTIGPSTATIWSGSVVRGITFQDTSASNNQVAAAIRVQRENMGVIENCSFEDITNGIGIECDGPSGNPQYWSVNNCNWFNIKYGIYCQQTAADWTINGGTLWGVKVGDPLIAGSRGFFLRGTWKIIGAHVQYTEQPIIITGGPASKIIGCSLENDPAQPGTYGIDIVTGDGCQIIGTDIVNGFSSAHIRVNAGVARTAIFTMEDTIGTGTIQDNGTNTMILDNSTSRTTKIPGPTTFGSEITLSQQTTNLSSGVKMVVTGANPEGTITAPVGSIALRTTGGAGTTFYVKESGSGNTGWVAK